MTINNSLENFIVEIILNAMAQYSLYLSGPFIH